MEIQQLIIADVARTAAKIHKQLPGMPIEQRRKTLNVLKDGIRERVEYFEDLRRRAEVGAITRVREDWGTPW